MSIEDLNLSRNQKVFIIKTVSERLQAKLLILNDSMSSLYYENFSLEARDLMADFCKFSNSVEQLQSNNEYSKIDDETLNYLTILSLVVSEEYRLKVRTPQGQKQYDFMVDKFKHDVYTVSLQRLNTNIAGFAVFKEALINEYNSKQYNYLAPVYEIIDLQNEIDEIDKKLDLCQWNSDDKGYSELSERKHEIKNRIKTIRNENPLACHFSNQFDVKQTILSLCYRVSKAMNNTRKSLVDKKYPIWELTPIITYLFENIEYYQDPKIQYEILEWLQEQRKLENGKKFATNALSISLSLLCICFSGGSSLFINMIRLAAITDGIIVAADDYQDAKMHSDMAHGQEFISDDAKKVIESSNLSAIDINYIFAAVSFGLALIDLKDCYKIIKQMNILDELSKAYLRIFKKPGVKLLNTFTAEEINKLAKLCSKYDKKLFAAICDLPEDEIRLILISSNSDKFVLILDNMTDSKITADVVENIADDINSGKKIFVEKSGSKGAWNKNLNKTLEANAIYYVDDYVYITDASGRIENVSGKLTLFEKGRNTYQQGRSIIIKDGIVGDDQGGHIIAQIFNGPGEQINYVPQTELLNNGSWKAMENDLKNKIKLGKSIDIKIKIQYPKGGNVKRPEKFIVNTLITDPITNSQDLIKYEFYNIGK